MAPVTTMMILIAVRMVWSVIMDIESWLAEIFRWVDARAWGYLRGLYVPSA